MLNFDFDFTWVMLCAFKGFVRSFNAVYIDIRKSFSHLSLFKKSSKQVQRLKGKSVTNEHDHFRMYIITED